MDLVDGRADGCIVGAGEGDGASGSSLAARVGTDVGNAGFTVGAGSGVTAIGGAGTGAGTGTSGTLATYGCGKGIFGSIASGLVSGSGFDAVSLFSGSGARGMKR
jgi:hypothetical protein